MNISAEPLTRLIEELNRLPGIGPKTAQRLAYYLLRVPNDQARNLAEAIREVKEKIVLCSQCFNFTETDPCIICSDEAREAAIICVVEDPLDILALERTRHYRGLYHVLHGALSPATGIGPEELKIKELMARLRRGQTEEVIIATNANLEGEATAMYLARLIRPLNVRVTRLARGLPVGGDVEYADEITLTRALEGRREM
ncbi:MAG: recombination mediator RecR [Chloroflexota bacterium]